MTEEKKKLAEHIEVDYPEVRGLSTNAIIKYKKAVDSYPDLKKLKNTKLVLIAYDFRREQIKEYSTEHTTELANARCNIRLGGYQGGKFMPGDLPALQFEKECVVCHECKKSISICPDCWEKIRRCLNLKGKSDREGWEGWGYEMELDLSDLIQLLKSERE